MSLLLLCHTLCLPAHATSEAPTEVVSAELFKLEKIKENAQGPDGNAEDDINLQDIKLQLFFAVRGGVIVAVAETNYKNDVEEKVGVVAKYFETDYRGEWGKEVIQENTKWKTQLATGDFDGVVTFSKAQFFAANGNNDEMYVFLLNSTDKKKRVMKNGIFGWSKEQLAKWPKAKKLTTSGTVNEAKEELNKVMLDPAAAGASAFLTCDKKELCAS